MTPRIEACYFGTGDGSWPRMARVLEHTAAQQCPGWQCTIACFKPDPIESAIKKAIYVSNAQKTAYWCSRVEEAPDGTPMLLIDVDTAILQPLDDIWQQPFDLAYTIRENWSTPLNGGVVLLRVSEPVRAFMRAWRDRTTAMLGDNAFAVSSWREKWKGIAQGALGPLLKSDHGLNILKLTCREWNCEDSAWSAYDTQATRIIHVKSDLRKAVFGRGFVPGHLRPLVARWHDLEAQAMAHREGRAS